MGGFGPAVNALKANSDAMLLTTSDIANANSIGGKESSAFFSAVVASTGTGFSGGGVRALAVQNVSAQGDLETSNLATHLAISGNGFFVCSNSNVANQIEYTRAGHFNPDKDGNLQNVAGLYLLGWETDEQGNVPVTTNASDVSSLIKINVNKINGLSKPTTNLSLGFNLPSDLVNGPLGKSYNTTTSVYDSLGARHDISVQWTRTSINPSVWDLSLTSTDGLIYQSGVFPATLYSGGTPLRVTFDGNGQPLDFGGAATPPPLSIVWDTQKTNAIDSVINLDLGTVGTLTGISCRSGNYQLTRQNQDGREFGTFRNVTIDDEGKIFAIYSNGQSLIIGRIALANFAAPDQLEAQTGNSYIETDASGTYSLSQAKSGGFGKIVSNALEASTVDLASKLTDLITLQNHYSANTRSIMAEKEELRELLSIK